MEDLMIDLNLTAREAQVIYIALSKVSFSGADDTAQAVVRYKLEKLIEEQTRTLSFYSGRSLHEYLLENDAIPESTEHPTTAGRIAQRHRAQRSSQ